MRNTFYFYSITLFIFIKNCLYKLVGESRALNIRKRINILKRILTNNFLIFNKNSYTKNIILLSLLSLAALLICYYFFFNFFLLLFIYYLLFLQSFFSLKNYLFSLYCYYTSSFSDFFFSLFQSTNPIYGFFLYFSVISFLSFFTFFFGVNGVYQFSLFAILLSWANQIFLLEDIISRGAFFFYKSSFSIQFFGSVFFEFSFCLDYISYCFLLLTTSIGVCAVAYSLAYMKGDPHADRFILLLNWFIFSMSFLVLADNVFICFLGWELIGLTSFLLINFWTLRRGTLKSAYKAFVFNKLSDLLFLFFIIYIVRLTGSSSILVWNQYFLIVSSFYTPNLNLSIFFLLGAASIKSAQFIGHLWLPDSMEAPIPASALIHSATLVSAGVYLLLRLQSLLHLFDYFFIIAILGAFTALYGAVVSAAQTDAKKLLAYSTISHCGFLFMSVYVADISLTITYLYLHGFFKALTFFSVGNLLKVSKGYQDTRRMGGFSQFLPAESLILTFCAVNLGALPFSIGYFYKHLFQALFYTSEFFFVTAPFLFLAMLVSLVYVFRLVFYSLFDIKKGPSTVYLQFTAHNLNKDVYSNTVLITILFIVLLLCFSYFYHLNFIFYFNNCNNIPYDSNFFVDACPSISSHVASLNYYFLFTSSFTAIIYLLIFMECRKEFSHLRKKNLYPFVFIFLLICQFFYICVLFFYF